MAAALYLLAFTDGTRYWGVSSRPARRLREHARRAGAVGERIRNPRVSYTFTVDWHPDRAAAEAAELEAILADDPDRLLNRAHNPLLDGQVDGLETLAVYDNSLKTEWIDHPPI